MKDRKKRLLAAGGATVLIHVIFAAALGIWGIHFYNHPPTEVLEVALVTEPKEPPPAPLIKKGSEPEPEEKPEEQPEEQPRERFTRDDIPDPEKEAPKPAPRAPAPASSEGAGDPNGDPNGEPDGDPNGSPDGQAGGTGDSGGGGETIGPQILSAPKPPYPSSARKAGITGTVVVGLTINSDGSVTSAWVISSSGNGALDSAAVNGVYSWRFLPAKQGGYPITVNSRVPVSFTLH